MHDRGAGRALRHRVLAAARPGSGRGAATGDAKGLFSLADSYSGRLEDGTYSNLLDANLAINCADTDEKYSESEIRTLAADWTPEVPAVRRRLRRRPLHLLGVEGRTARRCPKRDAAGSAPILVVGNTGDPVTPLPGAQDMAKDLDNGVLLIWQGQGHTVLPEDRRASPRRWTPT